MNPNYKILFLIIILSTVFISCDDKIVETYTANVPIYISYEELRSSVNEEPAKELVNPGKIYFYNDLIFINEYLKGVHIIDNSNPASPINTKFINIPGNLDISIKDDMLYADSYVDLVAIDISNLNEITESNRLEDIFPYILPPYDQDYRVDDVDYNKGIVVDWELKKITKEVEENSYPIYWYDGINYMESAFARGTSGYSSGASSFGVGGSMSRFTAIENVLYAIDGYSINIINIESPENIYLIKNFYVSWNIETLFPSGDNLFIGSQNGMIIYDISNVYNPVYVSDYWHMTSCDPVVVEGDYAYVTLRSGNFCGEINDQLDVIDISNLVEPTFVASYPMTEPYGLGIDNSTLFVCDGEAGLKIYDASDVLSIDDNLISSFPDIQAYDVIPINDILLLIGDDGFYQYDYSNLSDISLLSSITIAN